MQQQRACISELLPKGVSRPKRKRNFLTARYPLTSEIWESTKGRYIADVGYDSGEDETQIDIIYEDQDIRTVRVIEALQQRELHPKGRECDYGETFSLNKIRLRPKKQGNWKKRTRHHNNTIVSPTGDAVQAAKTEIRNRASTGRRTRASVAENKTARTRDIEARRTAHEGDQGTAFTEPSVFADRALSTGKRRLSERVAPGLGPGPAGGIRES